MWNTISYIFFRQSESKIPRTHTYIVPYHHNYATDLTAECLSYVCAFPRGFCHKCTLPTSKSYWYIYKCSISQSVSFWTKIECEFPCRFRTYIIIGELLYIDRKWQTCRSTKSLSFIIIWRYAFVSHFKRKIIVLFPAFMKLSSNVKIRV